MSSAVTSFWKSTKHLPLACRDPPERNAPRGLFGDRAAGQASSPREAAGGRAAASACAEARRAALRRASGRRWPRRPPRMPAGSVSGHEDRTVPRPSAAGALVRGQVQRRRPAARHGDEIAIDAARRPVWLVTSTDSTCWPPRAPFTSPAMAWMSGYRRASAAHDDGSARVDDCGDLAAGRDEVRRRGPAIVVVGEHDSALARAARRSD